MMFIEMDLNFLKIIFSLMTLFIVVMGSLINNAEEQLPAFITQTFRYGKFANKRKSILNLIEVPKRWFQHFYVFASAYTTLSLVVAFYIYFLYGTLPPSVVFCLDFLGSSHRKSSVSAVSSFLALTLLTIHAWHRLYETWCVSVFSKSSINISHYVIGFFHYFGTVNAILIESPGFMLTKDLNATIRVQDITLLDIYGSILFLWACYHQYKTTVILANLRKNDNGDVVSYKHCVPQGDWFEMVSSPHVLAEVLMYFALTLILWGAHTWPVVFLWVLSNQVETALLTHWWYQSEFKDYPKKRRAIIPYML